jgi:hypothetical protein
VIGMIRRLLGMDRFEASVPPVPNENRDRADARRIAARAKRLTRRLRQTARDEEIALRVEVLRR